MKNNFDYIVVGSGIAGMTTALTLSSSGSVAIFTKKNPSDSSTNLAQGGMAAMLGKDDRVEWHVEDTLKAGDFHNKKSAVSLLVKNSLEAHDWLKKQGVLFDTKPSLEAGHRVSRIFHTTDFTGQDIEQTLLKKVSENEKINIFKDSLAVDLIIKNGVCKGIYILNKENKIIPFFSKAVVLSTGGSGQVYQWTTNPTVATGDGIAIAVRAGAKISDLEFVQFHPTAFKNKTSPLFLLSERLRGEGAKLVDKNGKQFVNELLPRDVVARAVFNKQKTSEVYLTMAHLEKKDIIMKLPNIYKKLKEQGYDLTKDRVPITPAAHYQCGGITTDLDGKTSIKDLFAVGEVAATGVHGANRLASNSLLEAVVFGKRIGEYIKKYQISKIKDQSGKLKIKNIKINFSQKEKKQITIIKNMVKKVMWENVGIIRKRRELSDALKIFKGYKKQIEELKTRKVSFELIEISNLTEVAIAITEAALNRSKSLGAHYII